jgi:hypothetical protein
MKSCREREPWTTTIGRVSVMSEYGRDRSLHAFIDDLNTVRRAAGPPSYTQMERLSRRLENAAETASGVRVITLARSTTNDILTGDRRDRPKWEWVASFWAVLRLIAEQNGIDPARLGSLEEWRGKYDALDGAAAGADGPRRLPSADATADATGGGAWWHPYREVVPEWIETYLNLEPRAGFIRVYEPEYVPGLLQTEEYARATIRAGHPGEPAETIELRVGLRMARQRVLDRPDPLRLWAVLDERALSGDPVGAEVMRGQIAHLLKLCAAPHVTLQVRPAASGTDIAGNPVCLLRLPDRGAPDVIYLEQPAYGLYPDKPGDVRHYQEVLNRIVAGAPPPEASTGLLRRLLDDL